LYASKARTRSKRKDKGVKKGGVVRKPGAPGNIRPGVSFRQKHLIRKISLNEKRSRRGGKKNPPPKTFEKNKGNAGLR